MKKIFSIHKLKTHSQQEATKLISNHFKKFDQFNNLNKSLLNQYNSLVGFTELDRITNKIGKYHLTIFNVYIVYIVI